jgi:hypothetical protein
MTEISQLHWTGNTIHWQSSGQSRKATFQNAVANALVLRSHGIGVISGEGRDATACILDADGSTRATIRNPSDLGRPMGFYYFIYEGEILKIVLASETIDFAFSVDEDNGTLSGCHEVR